VRVAADAGIAIAVVVAIAAIAPKNLMFISDLVRDK